MNLSEGRIIAVGDVHGCSAALRALLAAIEPQPEDTIVALGDYIDRGPDSRGVLDELIALRRRCQLVPLLGNHDELLLEICSGDRSLFDVWLPFGGNATVRSYGGDVPEGVPKQHVEFLKECRPFYETPTHFFLHGSYLAHLPLEQQPSDILYWASLRERLPGPHRSGKLAIVGHTSQKDGQIVDLGYLKCIDTCCYGEGWLTALEVASGQIWQADKEGKMR